MNTNKYFDEVSVFNVIGNLMNNPSILDNKDKYDFIPEDFNSNFYMSIFGAINNLYVEGSNSISILDVENYLKDRPGAFNIYNANKGTEYLAKALHLANRSTFDYYYNRMRKMTVLREFAKVGANVKKYYDPDNIFNAQLKQEQEDWLMNSEISVIVNSLTSDIEETAYKFLTREGIETEHISTNLEDLILSFKETPDMGLPMYGALINSITRGMRLKKFYLVSAGTGMGKSRSMLANACYVSCSEIYDIEKNQWVKTGDPQPTSFFSTELELSEVQTMAIAFISGVNEEHILNFDYKEGEYERVIKAISILKNSKLNITEMPDFSLEDIETELRKHIREYNTTYLFFDYIHSSLKILEEVTKRTGGMKLREDQILFLISLRMKDLANQHGVFIMSGTQLVSNWGDSETPDQNLLRGARAIADKIDLGALIMPATPDDVKELQPILNKLGITPPTHYYSFYKNRRGKFKSVRLWCHGNLGICRLDPVFLTDHQYNFIPIDNLVIEVEDEEREFQPTNFEDVELKEAYERVF